MKNKSWVTCIIATIGYFIGYAIFGGPHLLIIGNIFLATAIIISNSKPPTVNASDFQEILKKHGNK